MQLWLLYLALISMPVFSQQPLDNGTPPLTACLRVSIPTSLEISPSLFLGTHSAECDTGASCALPLALICRADWYRLRLLQGANQMPHQHGLTHRGQVEALLRLTRVQLCNPRVSLPGRRMIVLWSVLEARRQTKGDISGCSHYIFNPRWRLVVQVKEQRECWTEPGRDLLNSAGFDHSVYHQSKKYECCIIRFCYFRRFFMSL